MELQSIAARFELHLHCSNCLWNVTAILDVPEGDDAPRCADDLAESAFLQRQRFHCERCEGAIGTLVGISQRSV